MQYPICIEWGDDNTATGIQIPDIPGAVTAGDTFEEAYGNQRPDLRVITERPSAPAASPKQKIPATRPGFFIQAPISCSATTGR